MAKICTACGVAPAAPEPPIPPKPTGSTAAGEKEDCLHCGGKGTVVEQPDEGEEEEE